MIGTLTPRPRRKGVLMKVAAQHVIALNNGTDQIVAPGDYREDLGTGPGRPPNGQGGCEDIVDGMAVVVGGAEDGPDFRLEGIVVNVEENRQAHGGKMCLVVLSEDASRIVVVPIASLLIGQAAKEAVARRKAKAAWSYVLKVAPETAELMEVLAVMHSITCKPWLKARAALAEEGVCG